MQMTRENNKQIIVLRIFLILASMGILFFMIWGELQLPYEAGWDQNYFQIINWDWQQVLPGGERVHVTAPGKCAGNPGEPIVIETILPADIEYSNYFCMRCRQQEVKVYIDDVQINEYVTKDSRPFGKYSVSAYLFTKLLPQYEGKTMRIEIQGNPFYSDAFSEMYYGERFSIWKHIFMGNIGVFFISWFILFLGAVALFICLIMRIFYGIRMNVEHLSFGVLLAGIWMLTQSRLQQLYAPNVSTISYVPVFIILIIDIPLLIYWDKTQRQRYHGFYMFFCYLDIANFFFSTALQLLNIREFSQILYLKFTLLFLEILFCFVTIFMDLFVKKIKEYIIVAIGWMGFSLSAILQMLLFYYRDIPHSAIFLGPGITFLLFMAAFKAGHDVLDMDREKEAAIMDGRAKARFLASMSHEIRTPINAILGMNEMILRESTEETIRDYANDVQNAGHSLISLVNDILDFSKIESGKLDIIPVEYHIHAILRESYHLIERRVNEKDLRLIIENNRSIPCKYCGDEKRIKQIIANLLTNAVKYTDDGSVILRVDGRDQEDNYILRIEVIDTGVGIREEDQKMLFDSFQRLDEVKNRNIEGTGLGLAITKQLVELMHGTIQIISEYGKGSTFIVELPQKVVDRTPAEAFSVHRKEDMEAKDTVDERRVPYFPEKHILVVDDVQVNLKVFTALLKETKVKIDTAISGAECLSLVQNNPYDLIFLDHMMPEMDGMETMHRMQKLNNYPNHNTPVIMLTANAIQGAREEYEAMGFQDYLTKPMNQQQLFDILTGYLSNDTII